MNEKNEKDFIKWLNEQNTEWLANQEEKAWEECKQGELTFIPKEVIEGLPPPFAKAYKKDINKYGGVVMNKLKPGSSRRYIFGLGFSKGWALALDTDEGFKWAKYHYEQRKKKKEKQEDVSK